MKGYMFGVIIDKPVPLSLDGENYPSYSNTKLVLLHNSNFRRQIISLRFLYFICQIKNL